MLEGTHPRLRPVFLSGAAVSVGASLGLAVVAAQDHLFGVDHGARELVRLTRHPLLQSPMETVSVLGDGVGLIPLIAFGCALLWRTNRHWALLLPAIMAGAGALQLLTKWAVDRPRPNLSPWGFPSGHVLTLVVFFGLMTYLIGRSRRCRLSRSLGTGLCVTLVLTVAFSRLYLDVHWFSDLVGGLTIGLAYLLTAIWLVEHGRAHPIASALRLPRLALHRRAGSSPGIEYRV